MIDLSLYPKFKADIQTKTLNIHTMMVIGWDSSGTMTDTGGPREDSIFISEKKEHFNDIYWHDLSLNMPTTNESYDFARNKFKVNNITIRLSNYKLSDTPFSDSFEGRNMINREVKIFYQSQSASNLSDCFPAYLGIIRKVSHGEKSVKITIEDYSEVLLNPIIPKGSVPSHQGVGGNIHPDTAVPMIYGNIDFTPLPATSFNPEDTGGDTYLTLYPDNHNLYSGAFESWNMPYLDSLSGDSFIDYDPIFYFDKDAESYWTVRRETYSVFNQRYNYFFDNRYESGLGYPLRINFRTSTQLNEIRGGDRESNTAEGTLQLRTYADATSAKVVSDYNIDNVDLAEPWSFKSYKSQTNWDNEVLENGDEGADALFNSERVSERWGGTGTNTSEYNYDSFIEFHGFQSPADYRYQKHYQHQIEVTFDNNILPSKEILVERPYFDTPTPVLLLGKWMNYINPKIHHTIRHSPRTVDGIDGNGIVYDHTAGFGNNNGLKPTPVEAEDGFYLSDADDYPRNFGTFNDWNLVGGMCITHGTTENGWRDDGFPMSHGAGQRSGIFWSWEYDFFYAQYSEEYQERNYCFIPFAEGGSTVGNVFLLDPNNVTNGANIGHATNEVDTQFINYSHAIGRWNHMHFSNFESGSLPAHPYGYNDLYQGFTDGYAMAPYSSQMWGSQSLNIATPTPAFWDWSGNAIRFGFGNHAYESRFDTQLQDQSSGIQYYFENYMRIYNMHLFAEPVISDFYNGNYAARIKKGRIRNNDTTLDVPVGGFTQIIDDIVTEELGIDATLNLDSDSYNKTRYFELMMSGYTNIAENSGSPWTAFAVKDFIKGKDLISDMMNSTLFFTRFGWDGKMKFTPIAHKYSNDTSFWAYGVANENYEFIDTDSSSPDNVIIKASDVIKFSYKQTNANKIYTKIKLSYNWDYLNEKYACMQETRIEHILSDYDMSYYGISGSSENIHSNSTLEIKSKYIRSSHKFDLQHINKTPVLNNEDGTTIYDGYSTDFAKYKLLNLCQQKLIIKCDLPMSYLWIESGDVVVFDKLLGDSLKAYGHDYTRLEYINGMWAYPAFMCQSKRVSKGILSFEFIQVWNLDDGTNNAHQWTQEDIPLPYVPPTPITEEEIAEYEELGYDVLPPATMVDELAPGDATGDGIVNVLDIIAIVNHLLEIDIAILEGQRLVAADANQDGTVNVVDIVTIVNSILHGIAIGDEAIFIEGCTNPNAINYDPNANLEDGSCVYNTHCTNPNAFNYTGVNDSEYTPVSDESICEIPDDINDSAARDSTMIADSYVGSPTTFEGGANKKAQHHNVSYPNSQTENDPSLIYDRLVGGDADAYDFTVWERHDNILTLLDALQTLNVGGQFPTAGYSAHKMIMHKLITDSPIGGEWNPQFAYSVVGWDDTLDLNNILDGLPAGWSPNTLWTLANPLAVEWLQNNFVRNYRILEDGTEFSFYNSNYTLPGPNPPHENYDVPIEAITGLTPTQLSPHIDLIRLHASQVLYDWTTGSPNNWSVPSRSKAIQCLWTHSADTKTNTIEPWSCPPTIVQDNVAVKPEITICTQLQNIESENEDYYFSIDGIDLTLAQGVKGGRIQIMVIQAPHNDQTVSYWRNQILTLNDRFNIPTSAPYYAVTTVGGAKSYDVDLLPAYRTNDCIYEGGGFPHGWDWSTSALLANVSYDWDEIYDDFGNSISSTGTIPLVKFNPHITHPFQNYTGAGRETMEGAYSSFLGQRARKFSGGSGFSPNICIHIIFHTNAGTFGTGQLQRFNDPKLFRHDTRGR